MADQAHIEEIEEQAALYALGALPPEDAVRFEQRLAGGCPLCGAELKQCQETVMALPLSAGAVAPPPALRARFLERIGAGSSRKTSTMGEGLLVRAGDTA